MTDETTVSELSIDSEIDSALDAFLTEEATSEQGDPTDAGTTDDAGSDDPIFEELQTLGLSVAVPGNLSPEAKELLSQVVGKANDRVKGFQSGFDKSREEFGAKAKVYDQLMVMPEFQQFLEAVRSGKSTNASEPAEPELDLAAIQAMPDPYKRLEAITDHLVEKKLRERLGEVDKRLSTVGAVVGKMGWDGFVVRHPDALQLKPEIDRLINMGHSAEEAYRYAKGASISEPDLEARIETRIAEREKARVEAKKKASGLGVPPSKGAPSNAGTDLVKYAKEHGEGAAMLKAIQEAEEATGYSYA
jgi:hypothetical protein